MLGLRESCRNHNVIYRRTNHAGQMGYGSKFLLPACPACSHYPNGCRWPFESRHCSQTQDFSAHRPTVATTLFGSSAFWPGKGCLSPWPYSANLAAQDHCCYPRYLAHNSSQRNALEYAQHGQESRSQRGHHSPNLEATQLKTSFDRNIQTQSRQAIHQKLHDVVGLYLNPPDKALVLCVDEKSQIQALDRTQPLLPLRPGIPARQTHDYKRNGTTTLFAALSMLDGKVIGDCMPRHRHQEFIRFLQLINVQTPADLDLHLIVDNYGTHKHPRVQSWLKRHPRFHLHFIPTSSSWLNMVERWFREITDKRIRRGSFKNVPSLVAAIKQYIETHNQNPKVFTWTASVEQIMSKIAKCKEALETVH